MGSSAGVAGRAGSEAAGGCQARRARASAAERISKRTLSLVEDSLAVFLSWMASAHPIVTAGIVVVLVILAVLLIRKLYRFFKQVMGRLSGKPSAESGPNSPAHAQTQPPGG